jgi:uncharacterized protein
VYKGNKVYDADAHVMMSPLMWENLPREYNARRPRPVRIGDISGAGIRSTGWLIKGRMEPHPYGPGSQGTNNSRQSLMVAPQKLRETIVLSRSA